MSGDRTGEHGTPTDVSFGLAMRLASLVVHAQEYDPSGDPNAAAVDLHALKGLADDPEVQEWLDRFGPGLLPEKRS
jgi:hypothetical protein